MKPGRRRGCSTVARGRSRRQQSADAPRVGKHDDDPVSQMRLEDNHRGIRSTGMNESVSRC